MVIVNSYAHNHYYNIHMTTTTSCKLIYAGQIHTNAV